MRPSKIQRWGAVLAAALVAALATGCGTSSPGAGVAGVAAVANGGASGARSATTSAPHRTAVVARSRTVAHRQALASAAASRPHRGPRLQHARRVGGQNDEISPSGAKPQNPCALITPAELRAITGRTLVRMFVAPLGPTCVVQLRGARTNLALTVEYAGFKQLVGQMKYPQAINVRGRRAYCAQLGVSTLYAPLSQRRVLHITAGCPQAQGIATLILGRVRG